MGRCWNTQLAVLGMATLAVMVDMSCNTEPGSGLKVSTTVSDGSCLNVPVGAGSCVKADSCLKAMSCVKADSCLKAMFSVCIVISLSTSRTDMLKSWGS